METKPREGREKEWKLRFFYIGKASDQFVRVGGSDSNMGLGKWYTSIRIWGWENSIRVLTFITVYWGRGSIEEASELPPECEGGAAAVRRCRSRTDDAAASAHTCFSIKFSKMANLCKNDI